MIERQTVAFMRILFEFDLHKTYIVHGVLMRAKKKKNLVYEKRED